jgi:UDP:flavonoid glycosyltransferase YjiC (YdhE family)
MPITVIAATAGRQTGLVPPSNAFLAEFLPGQETAARADLLITNGGNMSGYQGLAEGKPIIGLASNVDQFLNMAALEDAGAGKLLRARTASAEVIKQATQSLLNDSRAHTSAKCLGAELAISTLDVFVKTVSQAVTKGAPQTF